MGRITIVGVGFEKGSMTLAAVDALKSGAKVILSTERSGCAEWLRENGIAFETLDALYENCDDFDALAVRAAENVIGAAKDSDAVYAVFDLRDGSVREILSRTKAELIAGAPVEGRLFALCENGTQTHVASEWEDYHLSANRGALIREIDTRELASEVKIKLMDVYDPDCAVSVLLPNGDIAVTKLFDLDRLKAYDHRVSVYVPAQKDYLRRRRRDMEDVCRIVEKLCAIDGCPWDREQTHATLRKYIIEEAYEVAGAIDECDPQHMCEELGDMLFQIVFHADVGRRCGEFDISDVTEAISEKMIRRHSHIFGSDKAADAETVAEIWARNKMSERGEKTVADSIRSITKALPASMRAEKVLKRIEASDADKAAIEALKNDIAEREDALHKYLDDMIGRLS